jgi:hypothetical protein
VEVFTDRGEHFSAGLFVTETPFHASRLESVLETLNDERSFLPFRGEPPLSEFVILNKTHIMRVKLEQSPDGFVPQGYGGFSTDKEVCCLMLADGTRLTGQVAVDTRWTLSRLVDKLNQAGRFMTVVTPEHIELIQTSQVVRVD